MLSDLLFKHENMSEEPLELHNNDFRENTAYYSIHTLIFGGLGTKYIYIWLRRGQVNFISEAQCHNSLPQERSQSVQHMRSSVQKRKNQKTGKSVIFLLFAFFHGFLKQMLCHVYAAERTSIMKMCLKCV